MQARTLTLATLFTVMLSGSALAQTPAGGGSAEGNMNNPGSVKSNSQKSMEQTGSMSTGMTPGTSGGPPTSTLGAPAGSSMGNGVTGSGAAPSGR
ncbi:hypothetical protein GOFOIKOB_5198 [Methylobacterium tardum]|uniref:Proteophosphoglycan ppg4 n=1 Tax=Methylobacterium tardum TaxID=374432 RepID=A0AA37TGP6_9HYPH|nr:hypothetical protein [Methylobacterium tardum]URD39897.1 hypothetical protein M6G65_06460 [Methylobacterium tardum]GJE52130.1 hypothetical protein GOFOIKOB_5198 [Methylobacterium tardum]GLS71692.1 hypothetical protein GCM10007890_37050 [Methylobacterium tardum]